MQSTRHRRRGISRLSLLAVLSCGVLASPGCREGGTDAGKAKYTVGFSQCTVKEPWRVLFNQKLD